MQSRYDFNITYVESWHSVNEAEKGTAWSLEFGAWSLEFGAWSLEFGAWSLVFGAWSLEFGAWSLALGVWSLELGAWSLELGAWSLDGVCHAMGEGRWAGSMGRIARGAAAAQRPFDRVKRSTN